MFINPKTAITNGWIKGIKNEALQVQPNAIDFTLDEVYMINFNNTFVISEAGKVMRSNAKMEPVPQRDGTGDFWTLGGPMYDCLSSVYVEVPEGVAAMLVPRSTFARNGLFLASGLYDSGFKGHVGFVLHNFGTTKVGVGTRVGQIIFVEAASAKMYAGGYNHAVGTAAPHQE